MSAFALSTSRLAIRPLGLALALYLLLAVSAPRAQDTLSVAPPADSAEAAAMPEADPGAPEAPKEKPNNWEKAIQKYEAQDAEQMPPKGALLFVGSSSIKAWKLQRDFPDLVAINRGFGGSAIADSTYFAERIIFPYEPKAIIFYAGDNDVARKMTAEEVSEDFAEFVAKVRGTLPETPILFISIKPSLARLAFKDEMARANALIRERIEADPTLHYIDIWPVTLGEDGQPRADILLSDGLHLKPEGYRLWSAVVREKLVELDLAPPAPAQAAPETAPAQAEAPEAPAAAAPAEVAPATQ